MFNVIRSLYAAQYGFRVALSLGSAQELTDGVRFPAYNALVRRSRLSGLKAKECAQMLRSIVSGCDSVVGSRQAEPASANSEGRDTALNAAMLAMESKDLVWRRPV